MNTVFFLFLLMLSLAPRLGSAQQDPKEAFILKEVNQLVASVYEGESFRYHVEMKRMPSVLTNQGVEVTRVWPAQSGLPKGYLVVNVDYRVNNSQRTAKAQVYIQVSQHLPVPLKRIEAGEELTPDLLTYQWIDITNLRGEFVTKMEETEGMVAAGFLKNGFPFRPTDVTLPAIVQPGNSLTMYFNQNGIQLALPVVSRQSAAKNEWITVWCEKTRKSYKVKVISSSHVIWEQTL